MSSIYVIDTFKSNKNWEVIANSFYKYKIQSYNISIFGRDGYITPHPICRIHIAKSKNVLNSWKHKSSYNRTTPKNKPNLDFWFLYASDNVSTDYLLLDIIGPDAHNDPKWKSYINDLKYYYVDTWINGTKQYTLFK